jgi:multiple sugar transport system substrate-binding protein
MPRVSDIRPGRARHVLALGAVAALSAGVLAGCGDDSDSGGTVTLNWYTNPNSSGSYQQIADLCVEQADGLYDIAIQVLPATADGQREQLIRRLAAGDSSIDVMNIDPPYNPELANAGWLLSLEEHRDELLENVLEAPIASAVWQDELFAVPWNANTQLLWYKKSVAEAAGVDPTAEDFTWDQMIDAAIQTNTKISEQGNRYEGYMVWVNAMVLGAGGEILENTDAGRDADVTIDSPEGSRGAEIIQKLANSTAASAALSTSGEEEGRFLFQSEEGGFMLNWPYVYPAFQADIDGGALDPAFLDDLGWARYPRVEADIPSRPPLGGNNLAIGAFTNHPDEALEFVKCATSPEAETIQLQVNGDPPSNSLPYDDPEVQEAIPFAEIVRDSINEAGPRPVTPFYGDVSGSIQRTWHPPAGVQPESTPEESAQLISDVINDQRLL